MPPIPHTMQNVVIHHNPACGTSRNVVKMVKVAGIEPTVIEYLETGWTRPQLLALFAAADLTPRAALRTTKSPAVELGLCDEQGAVFDSVSDEALLEAMLEHPVLVNRPIVCTRKGVMLCRPSENVLRLVDVPEGYEYVKEDGEVVRGLAPAE